MIIPQFPDLQELKKTIDRRLKARVGKQVLSKAEEGFPNVIIHTQVTESYRPGVIGPISLFLNRKGSSRVSVEGRTVEVPPSCFYLTNRMQEYTLEIESKEPVEPFNIHIGEYFSEQALGALLTPADTILDDGLQQQGVSLCFHNQLYRKDAGLLQLLQQFRHLEESGNSRSLLFEETMLDLLRYLVKGHRDLVQKINRLPAIKQSTRVELYRRLTAAADYLQGHLFHPPDLDTLAGCACLSKYHFIRLFKEVYRVSPYQYLQELRMEKACSLLRHSDLPVQAISELMGFEDPHSFSRLFHRKMQVAPSQYREGTN